MIVLYSTTYACPFLVFEGEPEGTITTSSSNIDITSRTVANDSITAELAEGMGCYSLMMTIFLHMSLYVLLMGFIMVRKMLCVYLES